MSGIAGNGTTGGAGVQGTLLELARMATRHSDPVDVFMLLSERVVDLLPVAAGAVLIVDAGGGLHVVGTSESSTGLLEVLRTLDGDGPGRQCVTTGALVIGDMRSDGERWPALAGLLAREGFDVVHVFPLLSRSVGVGALSLLGARPLDDGEREIAQALADLAALALLRSDAEEDALVVARRLHRTVQARATLGQAVGMIAERFHLDPDRALRRIRRTATAADMPMVTLAAAIVARTLSEHLALALAREER
jgi:GAF domain-containing protein